MATPGSMPAVIRFTAAPKASGITRVVTQIDTSTSDSESSTRAFSAGSPAGQR